MNLYAAFFFQFSNHGQSSMPLFLKPQRLSRTESPLTNHNPIHRVRKFKRRLRHVSQTYSSLGNQTFRSTKNHKPIKRPTNFHEHKASERKETNQSAMKRCLVGVHWTLQSRTSCHFYFSDTTRSLKTFLPVTSCDRTKCKKRQLKKKENMDLKVKPCRELGRN